MDAVLYALLKNGGGGGGATAVVGWDGQSEPDASKIPAGVTVTYQGVTYTGTLAASEDTAKYIVLVFNGGEAPNVFDEYHTVLNGESYVWEAYGQKIDLSDYYTKTEVDAKFTDVAFLSSIDKIILSVPVPEGPVEYTGSPVSPEWYGYDPTKMTIGGDTSATNAGNYTATFTLIDTDAYCWADGTTEVKSVGWEIAEPPAIPYLCFENVDTEQIEISWDGDYGDDPVFDNLQYSINSTSNWQEYADGDSITLAVGDKCYWKGGEETQQIHFNSTGMVAASGEVDSIRNWAELADRCYSDMFMECLSLTSAPELPATELIYSCYSRMFSQCVSLETAPALPATALAETCYLNMFELCGVLNEIHVAFTEWNDDETATEGWLYGVAEEGDFYCPADLEQIFDGSHIPEGWTVHTI